MAVLVIEYLFHVYKDVRHVICCSYIGDAVPAIFIATLMFCIPNKIPNSNLVHDDGKADALLDWPIVHKKYPWSIIFLMGGGFALAEACEVTMMLLLMT